MAKVRNVTLSRAQAAALAARLKALEWNGSVNDCFDNPRPACIACAAIKGQEQHELGCEFVALYAELLAAAD